MLLGLALVLNGTGAALAAEAPNQTARQAAAGRVVLSSIPFYRPNLREIPLGHLTHVVYAMVEHGPDGRARPRPEDTAFAANAAYLRGQARRHPRLTTLLGFGGGGWSQGFAAATTAARVGASAKSAVALMHRHGFGGIDIDWESPTPGTAEPAQYVAYLAAIRREMDMLGATTGRRYVLSTDVGFLPEDPFNTQGKDQTPPRAAAAVDLWNVMAYEMRGPWNCPGQGGGAGFNAPLRPMPGDPYARNAGTVAVAGWRRLGVPAGKIVLGIPFYGTLFRGVAPGPRRDGLGQPCTGTAGRQIDAPELATLGAANGFAEHYNRRSEAAYRYNPRTREFLSYETPRSIRAKRRFATAQGLAGVMSWDLGSEVGRYPLLRALSGG